MFKNTILSLSVFFLFFSFSFVSADQQEAVKLIPVSQSIYMVEFAMGGNAAVLVGNDGILIVDDNFEEASGPFKKELAKISDKGIEFIINTHFHGDHTGANNVFGHDSTIVAHHNVRKRLMTRQEVKEFNMVQEPQPLHALPEVTYAKAVTLHVNGEEIETIHFPTGHTDGDSVVFFKKQNVVHLGDLFFNGMYPFIDLAAGGDVEGFKANVKQLLETLPNDVKIIPGHGPLGTKGDLQKYYDMLVNTSNIVKVGIESQLKREMLKSIGFSKEIMDEWGGGVLTTEKWIDILYNYYSRQG